MYISKVMLAAAYFVAVYASTVAITNLDFSNITVGAPFVITWVNNTGLVTLELMDGPKNNLQLVQTIASKVPDESYNWTASNVPSGTYNFKITDPSNVDPNARVNFSKQFNITGGNTNSTPESTSSSSHSAQLSSNSKIIIAAVVSAITVVIALCAGLWIRHLRRRKARGNHPPRTMTTDAMREMDMSQSQYITAPLTPNMTHFAFSARELPQKPRSRRSTEYEIIFDEEALKVGAQAQSPWNGSTASTQVHRSANSPGLNSRNLAFQEPESPTPKTRQFAPDSSNLLARFNAASELEDNNRNIVELSASTPQNARNYKHLNHTKP